MTARRLLLWAAATVVAVAVVAVGVGLLASGGREPVTYTYVVPRGTGDRIEAGSAAAIMPRRLHLRVGDTVVIRNEDTTDQLVGPYFVAAGQTLRQTFATRGTQRGVCTLHPEGAITIIVDD